MTTQKKTFGSVAASAGIGLLIVAALAGVGFGLPYALTGISSEIGQSATSANDETIAVVDAVGRTVDVPRHPQHIAASDSFAGNVCVLVGAGENMMGAPGGVLSNTMLQSVYPELSSLTKLSGDTLNVEDLLASSVDVVIVRKSLYDDGGEVAKLDRVGIPYVVIDYQTLEDQIEMIKLVGTVCGEDAAEVATRIADFYQSTLDLVEVRAATLSDDQKVGVYHSINDALLTDGSESLGADWIARVGAIDLSASEASTDGQGDYTATLEQVYAWSPDVIVCNSASTCKEILADEQWQGMRAVKNGSVYNLPVSTSRWGQRGDPETFLAMLWLGKTVYPDLYEDIDLKQTVVSYYEEIIGLEIDDALWDAIVAGEGIRTEGSGGGGGGGNK